MASAGAPQGPKELPSSPTGMVMAVRGVIGSVSLLALLVCCSRLYIRRFVTKAFGLDDYLVIVALIFVLGFAILSIILTTEGIGYHQDTIPLEKMPQQQFLVYISLTLYLWVALAVKASLTVFIMRVFPAKSIRYFGIGMIVFMVLLTISGELPLILQCKPVEAAYDKTIPGFECFSADVLMKVQLYQAVLMFVIDLVIVALPMPSIWKLQMPVQRRLVIIGLFALGLVACSAGLARIPTLGYQQNVTDFSYAGALPLILMNTEYCLGLIAGSLPSLRVMFGFIPGLRSSRKSTHPSNDPANSLGQPGYQLSNQARWKHKVLGSGTGNREDPSILSSSQERIVNTSKPTHGQS